ncbi:hypothetical protein LINPERPRIM_LOCUS32303 [Linum perenne]
MGILFIVVGFLFKITAFPFRAAVGRKTTYNGRVGSTAQIVANFPNCARARLRVQ